MLTVLMLTILACMQVILLYFARSVALAAAQEGVRASRAENASRTAGAAVAERYAEQTAGGFLSGISASMKETGPDNVRVMVAGQSLSLVPFLASIPVEEEAAGVIEEFNPPARTR
ncbi:hypothetical protein HII36_09650 [Nonomuraea sp. NN258]|nr:hypothetical protein [Nonomuraea antri]